jgi:hypothetical protein
VCNYRANAPWLTNKLPSHLLISGSSLDNWVFYLLMEPDDLELGRPSSTAAPALYPDPLARTSLAHNLLRMEAAGKRFWVCGGGREGFSWYVFCLILNIFPCSDSESQWKNQLWLRTSLCAQTTQVEHRRLLSGSASWFLQLYHRWHQDWTLTRPLSEGLPQL